MLPRMRDRAANTDILAEALTCLRADDVAGAHRLLDPVLAAEPANAPALALRGLCRLMAGELDDAVAELTQAADLLPRDAAMRANLASALRRRGEDRLQAGEPAAAQTDFLAALDRTPEDAAALFGLAQAAQELGQYDDALAAYDAYLGAAPEDTDAHLGRGFCLQELRRLDEALAAYRAAVTLDRACYADAVKRLTTASHGCLWLTPSALRRALGLAEG